MERIKRSRLKPPVREEVSDECAGLGWCKTTEACPQGGR